MKAVLALLSSGLLCCGGQVGGVAPGEPGSGDGSAPQGQPPSCATCSTTPTAPPFGTPPEGPDGSTTTVIGEAGIIGDAAAPPPTATLNLGGTIAFVPTSIDVNRFPNVCGVMNPPFMAGDLVSMDVIGNMGSAPYDALDISFPLPGPGVDVPLSLTVMPYTSQGTGIGVGAGPTMWFPSQGAQGAGVSFTYMEGTDPGEIDTGAFDSVVLTVLAMPTATAQPLTLRLQIHFVDGKTLDETFSGPLFSSWGGCGAG